MGSRSLQIEKQSTLAISPFATSAKGAACGLSNWIKVEEKCCVANALSCLSLSMIRVKLTHYRNSLGWPANVALEEEEVSETSEKKHDLETSFLR